MSTRQFFAKSRATTRPSGSVSSASPRRRDASPNARKLKPVQKQGDLMSEIAAKLAQRRRGRIAAMQRHGATGRRRRRRRDDADHDEQGCRPLAGPEGPGPRAADGKASVGGHLGPLMGATGVLDQPLPCSRACSASPRSCAGATSSSSAPRTDNLQDDPAGALTATATGSAIVDASSSEGPTRAGPRRGARVEVYSLVAGFWHMSKALAFAFAFELHHDSQ